MTNQKKYKNAGTNNIHKQVYNVHKHVYILSSVMGCFCTPVSCSLDEKAFLFVYSMVPVRLTGSRSGYEMTTFGLYFITLFFSSLCNSATSLYSLVSSTVAMPDIFFNFLLLTRFPVNEHYEDKIKLFYINYTAGKKFLLMRLQF